ncbi:MAG TPA: cupredoxin domain-containing protein [Actinomycetota bacterium]|nr:cupredoxin domain-containing protein [Actinomycetota bacterium]
MARCMRLLSLFTVLVLGLSACGGDDGGTEDAATGTGSATNTEAADGTPTPIAEETRNLTGGESANFHEEADVSNEDSIELELDDNYFEPTVLTGTANQEITLELFNEGGNIHNFSLSAQNVDQDLQEGGTEEVSVRFPESGAVTFFCKYHSELGMRGELRVA